jgi:Flp pilus assembly protein TadB
VSGAVPVPPRDEGRGKKSLIQLIGDLPGLVGQLIRDEIEQIKKELTEKFTKLGVGAGLFAGAAFFGFFGFAVLVTTVILALALVLPAWLAALIVAVLLLLVTGALAFLGLRQVKKGVPPVPEESIQSVKDDVRAFKGMGKYDR